MLKLDLKEENVMEVAVVLYLYFIVAAIIVVAFSRTKLGKFTMWYMFNKYAASEDEQVSYEEFVRTVREENRQKRAKKLKAKRRKEMKRNAKKQGRKIINERRKETAKRYSNSIERQKYADRK